MMNKSSYLEHTAISVITTASLPNNNLIVAYSHNHLAFWDIPANKSTLFHKSNELTLKINVLRNRDIFSFTTEKWTFFKPALKRNQLPTEEAITNKTLTTGVTTSPLFAPRRVDNTCIHEQTHDKATINPV